MNREDPILSSDPEKSLAETLDNSIKNITGIKDSTVVDDAKDLNLSKETSNAKSDEKEVAVLNNHKESNVKNDLIVDKSVSSNNTIAKLGNQIKLPGKQISGTIAKDRVTGQYVLIQPGGGPAVPVRLASSNGNTTKQVAVQVIRKSDGTLIPLKSNKPININNVSLTDKKIITTNSGQTVLLNKSASITGSTNTTSTSLIRSSTISSGGGQIQRQQIMKAVAIPGDKAKYLTNSSTIVNIGNKLVVKSDNKKIDDSTMSLQKMSSQKFIKLSPTTSTSGSGNVQTLQLTGKTGGSVQYVRVLNAGVNKESLSPTKVFVKNQDGHIRMVTRINQQPLLDGKTIIVKDNPNKITQDQLNQQRFTTVPTLRKINESSLITSANNKIIAIKREEVEKLNARLKQRISSSSSLSNLGSSTAVQKPRILNNLGRLTGNLSISSSNNLQNQQQRQHLFKKIEQIGSGIASSNALARSTFSNIKISPKQLTPIGGSHTILRNSESPQKLFSVLKPTQNIEEQTLNVAASTTQLPPSLQQSLSGQRTRSPSPTNDGGLRRKHCNCTKSQCLKLYCDCFANGEFCQDCNCKECFNNLEYEDERQKAIKMCLERNPSAFKPKITKARDQNDLRLHNKGCNCKRSGCLKNYCECYEAKIACSSNCKCIGCRNVEDRTGIDMTDITKITKNFSRGIPTKRPYDEISNSGISVNHSIPTIGNKISGGISGGSGAFHNDITNLSNLNQSSSGPPAKQAYNFITQDVVDATIQCMIAQADECQKGDVSVKTTERMILEELGRCLVEIIDFSIKNFDN